LRTAFIVALGSGESQTPRSDTTAILWSKAVCISARIF